MTSQESMAVDQPVAAEQGNAHTAKSQAQPQFQAHT